MGFFFLASCIFVSWYPRGGGANFEVAQSKVNYKAALQNTKESIPSEEDIQFVSRFTLAVEWSAAWAEGECLVWSDNLMSAKKRLDSLYCAAVSDVLVISGDEVSIKKLPRRSTVQRLSSM